MPQRSCAGLPAGLEAQVAWLRASPLRTRGSGLRASPQRTRGSGLRASPQRTRGSGLRALLERDASAHAAKHFLDELEAALFALRKATA